MRRLFKEEFHVSLDFHDRPKSMPPLATADSGKPVPRALRLGPIFLLLLSISVFAASCQKKQPLFEEVPAVEDLYEEGMRTLAGGPNFIGIHTVDYDGAIEIFQTIIDNYPYSEFAVEAELRIADAYYEDRRYEDALSYYRSFSDLHPQHEKVPYTVLRSALCHYQQIGSINRDQTTTREAQVFLERLIRQYPYAPETREGEAILRELRTQLARHMTRMGDFYLERNEFQAAAERFRSVLNIYPGLGMDAEGLYKLGVCYENMMRQDEARRLFHVVVANYPRTHLAKRAAERIAASDSSN